MLLPIREWLPRYDRGLLRGDLAAGIAVTALIVPKNLGYAGIAGIPVENGLYAAAAGALLYAVFGTCRQISTGPSSGLPRSPTAPCSPTGLKGGQAAELVAAQLERPHDSEEHPGGGSVIAATSSAGLAALQPGGEHGRRRRIAASPELGPVRDLPAVPNTAYSSAPAAAAYRPFSTGIPAIPA